MSLMPTGIGRDDDDAEFYGYRPLGAAFHNDEHMYPAVELKMYVFRPRMWGSDTYIVVAESQEEATKKVVMKIKSSTNTCLKSFIRQYNTGEYDIEVYNLGEVVINENA